MPMFEKVAELFSTQGFMPHIHCYLAKPSLVWSMATTDTMIGLAYTSISITLWALIRKIKLPFNFVVFCFGVFIAACGATHFMEVWTLWHPDYWWAAWVKVITAVASVGTGVYLFRLRRPIMTVAEAAKLSEQRRLDLEALTKSLEKRVEERTVELQAAVRARDQFISIASHELRTPITSMKVQAQTLNRLISTNGARSIDPALLDRSVSTSLRQIDRLAQLVDDMLDASRIAMGRLAIRREEMELAEMVRDVLSRYEAQLRAAGCSVRTRLDEGVKGQWDRFRLEQVVTNFLTNAMRYAAGTAVDVEVERSGEFAVLRVRDHGPGIPRERLDTVFERFERGGTETALAGLGLGLFIVKEIVNLHDGTASVESELGKGSTFIVKLPL